MSAEDKSRAAKAPRKLSEANINRREEILDATERVLRRDGYSGLTARKVAAEAGFSLGHITYNFSGMDEVLSETYRRLSGRLRESTANAGCADAPPLARLAGFLDAAFTPEFLDAGHLRLRIDLWSAALTSGVIAATESELYGHYRSDLEGLLLAVAGDDPARRAQVPLLTDTLMATLDGLWLDWMRRRDDAGIRHGLKGCMALVHALLP
ncbi:TetR family transcriptional regulator [Pseudomonas sp. GX19020]|uniref:TetR/AcrR family transcriptional regulator n=1 Tax=Pseudomonas sp. GX19020 TaxID=2942277 RepID=UPI0020199EC8|nr:TetR family transcriptional regulator C-terminal domain-containing protein [Pseudomonas sp. GX19020]MCL4068288.1 TetR family transcriptional regulator [Pseudomonas sp. GX19020]